MSAAGYNGNTLIIKQDSTKIAAVRTKTMTQERTEVDVTTDDNDGWQRFLPRPGVQGMNFDVGGVVTSGNEDLFLSIGEDEFLTVEVELPNGDTMAAADGFFLGTIAATANHDGAVEFTATLRSSGKVTVTPAAGP